jgi:prevent-host-death family protein
MKSATISQARNTQSALIDRVRQGESIVITDRSRPVARLEPLAGSAGLSEDAGRVARLERAGIIRRAGGERREEILRVPPPEAARGGDILAVLLEERRDGR